MAESMTPSPLTDGQIDKAVDVYRSILRNHREELGSEPAQQVLGQPEFVEEMVGVLRKRVAAVSNMIVRRVRVDRTRFPRQALEATGRRLYVNDSVVETMPGRGTGAEDVDVISFKLNRFVSDPDLEKEYESRGLKPTDPYALAAVNEADPTFADEHPNGTHWKDKDGRWCFAAFDRWLVGRDVFVSRDGGGWGDYWSFAGVRK